MTLKARTCNSASAIAAICNVSSFPVPCASTVRIRSAGHALNVQVQFAAYKQFCDDTTTEKQRAIKEANAMMEQLSASIAKAEADAGTLWDRFPRPAGSTTGRPQECSPEVTTVAFLY